MAIYEAYMDKWGIANSAAAAFNPHIISSLTIPRRG